MIASVSKYNRQKEITNQIDYHLNKIGDDTAFSSNHSDTRNHSSFKHLYLMGTKIIPYLIHHMTHYGIQWHHLLLLGAISNEKPIQPEHAGQFYFIIADWLSWYMNSKYYSSDIYYGLVDDTDDIEQ